MVEVYPGLFLGSETDYEMIVIHQTGWWIVHACKEPYHRRLLGYKGRGAPKNHPEYLVARRANRLFLNLVDADDPAYIPKGAIDAALKFVDEALKSGHRVLVHCNQGESRAPSIGLLYLVAHTDTLPHSILVEAVSNFRKIYPGYCPKAGMAGFLQNHWKEYIRQRPNGR